MLEKSSLIKLWKLSKDKQHFIYHTELKAAEIVKSRMLLQLLCQYLRVVMKSVSFYKVILRGLDFSICGCL